MRNTQANPAPAGREAASRCVSHGRAHAADSITGILRGESRPVCPCTPPLRETGAPPRTDRSPPFLRPLTSWIVWRSGPPLVLAPFGQSQQIQAVQPIPIETGKDGTAKQLVRSETRASGRGIAQVAKDHLHQRPVFGAGALP